VIDECDKLFEDGFRDQLSVIFQSCGKSAKVNHAMFSATHDIQLEKWAKLNLDNLVSVVIGGKNNASQEVDQKLTFVGNESVLKC
jgi:ATP-dependent RNA helicase DDX52/ROK1